MPRRSFGDGKEIRQSDIPGPNGSRSCTDIIFGIIFGVCVIGLLLLVGWSFVMGDYRKMIFPRDSNEKVCGIDYPDKKHLFFFDIISCFQLDSTHMTLKCKEPMVCVSKCPNYTWSLTSKTDEPNNSREEMICIEGVSPNSGAYKQQTREQLVSNKLCSPVIIPTTSAFGRCIPDQVLSHTKGMTTLPNITKIGDYEVDNVKMTESGRAILNGQSIFGRLLDDFARSWKFILVGFCIAALVSGLWICLLRCCAAVMVYVTLTAFVLLFVASTAFCFRRYQEIKNIKKTTDTHVLTLNPVNLLRNANTWLALGIITLCALIFILIMLIFLRKRIRLAIVLLAEASRAVAAMPFVIIWPIVPFFMISGVLCLTFIVDINLRSIGTATFVNISNPNSSLSDPKDWLKWKIKNALPCDQNINSTLTEMCHFISYGTKQYIPYVQVYNFAISFWLLNYCIALGEMTLAGAYASFYFSRRDPKRLMPTFPVLKSFGQAIIYHTGTLAIGSFLITLLQIWISFLIYLEKKVKGTENIIIKTIGKCCVCCFWCLHKMLRFINKNAYIITAIYGYGFCRSAKTAFNLILRNVVRVFVVDQVTDYILFVGKLIVCGFTGLLAYIFFDGTYLIKIGMFSAERPSVNYIMLPVGIIIVGSYFIAKAFFSVYEMGVDTIFICFCEDLDRNDGSVEKPYYMPKRLMSELGKSKD